MRSPNVEPIRTSLTEFAWLHNAYAVLRCIAVSTDKTASHTLPASCSLRRLAFLVVLAVCLNGMPLLAQRAPNSAHEFADFVEPDFPFITTTLDAGNLGGAFPKRNVAVRCLTLMLGNETYACFDTDLLRVSASWHGEFMSLSTMAQVSYNKAGSKGNAIPEVLGEPLTATGMYPGWLLPGYAFEDPRPAINPSEPGRGPIEESLGYWHGVRTVKDRAVLVYSVGNTEIEETMSSLPGRTGIVRSFQVQQNDDAIKLVLAEYVDADDIHIQAGGAVVRTGKETLRFQLAGHLDGIQLDVEEERYLVATINSVPNRAFGVAAWKAVPGENINDPIEVRLDVPQPEAEEQDPRWPEVVTTTLEMGEEVVQGYTIDELTLPVPNPWNRNVRIAGLDFFSNGDAAVSTFEGDIWLIKGLTDTAGTLTWKRYASGLYEPMSLSIVDDQIYTFGREGIITYSDLNGDSEADYYKNFSNGPIQTIESREYPSSMHPAPEGGFYLAKGAATNNGPKTSKPVMMGFRAGGAHSGSILKVSADGRTVERFATGFRQPYIGVHPEKGWVTATDQQGNFVPSSQIYYVQEGEYYGVPATAHQDIPPAIAEPLSWVPHNVDRSGTEQVWMLTDQFGPLSGSMIHLSYGQPGVYLVYATEQDGALEHGGITYIPIPFQGPLMEGAMHPIDGQLYTGGFQVWDSSAEEISALYRMRYVGGAFTLPLGFKKGRQGVTLEFDVALDKEAAEDIRNYTSKRWNYKRSGMYGSGIFRRSGLPGREQVGIANAVLSEDKKTVFIQLHDLQNVMQMELSYTLKTAQGEPLEHSVYFSWRDEADLDLVAEGLEADAFIEVEEDEITYAAVEEKVASLERGIEIYQQIGCIGCHSADGSTEGRSGPTFLGLMGRMREFNDGTSMVADDAYIRESIYSPNAREVKGLDVEMPSYEGLLDEVDVASIILFIQSLEENE